MNEYRKRQRKKTAVKGRHRRSTCDASQVVLRCLPNCREGERCLPNCPFATTFACDASPSRQFSLRSAKGRPTDMHDDTSALTTQSYHTSYLPLPPLLPRIPCPSSDRCDTTGVLVTPSRRSTPDRWHLQVQSRARVEDDPTVLVQDVAKYVLLTFWVVIG